MDRMNPDMYYNVTPDPWYFSLDYNRQPAEIMADHYQPMKKKKYWNEDVEKTLIILGFVGLTLYVMNHSYLFT
jgi:hypothetical protein